MTAISTTTGGWCCRSATRAPVRANAAASARKESVKPERGKSESATPLKQRIAEAEAEIERINGIIAKIDTALALPDLFTRDPKQAAQLSKARAGAESALQRRRGRLAGGQLAV